MKNSAIFQVLKMTLRKEKAVALGLVLFILLAVLFSLLPAQFLRIIIDEYLVMQKMSGLSLLIGLYLAALLMQQLSEMAKNALLTFFGQSMLQQLRFQMMDKISRLNIQYMTNNTSAAISSRIINDVNSVSGLFADGLISLMIDSFKILGIMISIWFFSKPLGILVMVSLPLVVGLSRYFQKRMLKAEIDNLKQLSFVNEHIQETLRNIQLIITCNKTKFMEKRYHEKLVQNFETIEKVNFFDALYSPMIQMIRALMIGSLVLLVATKWPFDSISVGMVAASIELISNLFAPIEALGTEIQSIQKGISGIKRIDEFMQEKEEPIKEEGLVDQILKESNLTLSFEHLSFGYGDNPMLFQDLNVTFNQTGSTTLMGRTGAGKSTLFKLMLGLLKPSEGRICINGVDVYQIDNNEKRRLFGYVQQQFLFIEGTIAQQISLNDEFITQQEIENVMKLVGLHETVLCLEKGYDTPVHPERDFSQGQQQLLSIARAIVSNPPILLLDEISASLDSLTEERIMNVLKQAQKNRFVFSISHRYASILDRGYIYNLDENRLTK